ncbi:hypothetical protein [Streptomyces bambusae]|uniref:Uncharacterized protein n=1 Tax=Streptomyces bambusae TaxID=1550616 RepID=A0ABS6Z2V3_9ACTN|nr:hypothetical protein [Streptomyces bambusae]MBW5482085.1 hypothetical protein [Streptomyces bambusae]
MVSKLAAMSGIGHRQARLRGARIACAWVLFKIRTLLIIARGPLLFRDLPDAQNLTASKPGVVGKYPEEATPHMPR